MSGTLTDLARTLLAILLGGMLTLSGAVAEGSAPLPRQTAVKPARSISVAVERNAPALDKADVSAWLDGYVPYALAAGNIAGAQVVVVKDGEVLAQKGYGYADVTRKVPMDPERIMMRIGSTSKLFTWIAVMQLVEQGKLDLNKDISGLQNPPARQRADYAA
jgi:CubicO group peptidase (beta-lactamase class C family)